MDIESLSNARGQAVAALAGTGSTPPPMGAGKPVAGLADPAGSREGYPKTGPSFRLGGVTARSAVYYHVTMPDWLWIMTYLGTFIFGVAIRPQAGRDFSWLQGTIAGTLWCLYLFAACSGYRVYNEPNENIGPFSVALGLILILRLTLFFWQRHMDAQEAPVVEGD